MNAPGVDLAHVMPCSAQLVSRLGVDARLDLHASRSAAARPDSVVNDAAHTTSHAAGSEYSHDVPIRWSDLDALGHVNHATYLSYLEEGRDAWLRSRLGVRNGSEYVVAALSIEYRQAVKLDEDVVRAIVKPRPVSRDERVRLGVLGDSPRS